MLTPLRFRDSDDPLVRELLASVDQDCAPSVSRARVAQGLGLGASTWGVHSEASNAAPAPGAARGMPSRLLRLRLVALQKYLLVGLATGLAVVAGWWLTAPVRSDALPSTAVLQPAAIEPAAIEPAAIEPAAIEPAAIEPAAIEVAMTHSTPVALRSEAARVTPLRSSALASPVRMPARRSAVIPAPAPAPRQSDTLLAEVAQLDRARAALRDQRAANAISELDAYVAAFPHAELALEADMLRVHALIAAREPSAAAALAGRLLDRPGSEQYRSELRRVIAAPRQ
jgi:hypothetical protein